MCLAGRTNDRAVVFSLLICPAQAARHAVCRPCSKTTVADNGRKILLGDCEGPLRSVLGWFAANAVLFEGVIKQILYIRPVVSQCSHAVQCVVGCEEDGPCASAKQRGAGLGMHERQAKTVATPADVTGILVLRPCIATQQPGRACCAASGGRSSRQRRLRSS